MNVFAKFYDRMVKTSETNPKNGLPIFKEVCFIEIRIKNNATDVVDQPATKEKIARFPKEYQCYLEAKEKEKTGTALSLFAFLTPLEQETLKSHGIFTLEDFVSLPMKRVRDLSLEEEYKKAKSFIKMNKNQSFIKELEKENALLKKEVLSLKNQLSQNKGG